MSILGREAKLEAVNYEHIGVAARLEAVNYEHIGSRDQAGSCNLSAFWFQMTQKRDNSRRWEK